MISLYRHINLAKKLNSKNKPNTILGKTQSFNQSKSNLQSQYFNEGISNLQLNSISWLKKIQLNHFKRMFLINLCQLKSLQNNSEINMNQIKYFWIKYGIKWSDDKSFQKSHERKIKLRCLNNIWDILFYLLKKGEMRGTPMLVGGQRL